MGTTSRRQTLSLVFQVLGLVMRKACIPVSVPVYGMMLQLMVLSVLLMTSPFLCLTQRNRNQSPDVYTRTCDSELEEGDVVHAYELKNFGCLLVCSILSPSSAKYKDFLNHFALRTHRLSGLQCVNETYVCINGTCAVNPLKVNPLAVSLTPFPGNDVNEQRVNPVLRPPTSGLNGNVSVKFANAHIAHDDNAFNKGDPYVKFFVGSRFIDKTSTRYNTHYPKFDEIFSVNSLMRMDILKFEVWNENSSRDDYVFSVTTTCDEILSKRMQNKKRSWYAGPINRLVLTITCAGF